MTELQIQATEEALRKLGGIGVFKGHSPRELFDDAFVAGAKWQREVDAKIAEANRDQWDEVPARLACSQIADDIRANKMKSPATDSEVK